MSDEGKENQADPQVHPALETKVLQGYYKKSYRFQQINTLTNFTNCQQCMFIFIPLGTISIPHCSKF